MPLNTGKRKFCNYFVISKTTISLFILKQAHLQKKDNTVAYENNDKKMESVYSIRVKAGKRRTYFFDVRETRGSDYYLTITESRKRFDSEGYDRHKIFLYKEDFNKFIKGLGEAIDYVKTDLMPDFDFDAFNHENPYEGEEGSYQNTPSNNADDEMKSNVSSEKEVTAPSSNVESDYQAPLDNGSTEEVDKW